MKAVKQILIVVGAVFLGLFLIGFIMGLVDQGTTPTLTQTAKDNTFKNAYVSGCTEGGDVSESVCSCSYDRLLALHPDLTTNKERMNRILTDGYNREETNAIVSCT